MGPKMPEVPAGTSLTDFEKRVTTQAAVIDWLKRSLDALKKAHAAITPADLQRKVKVEKIDATLDGISSHHRSRQCAHGAARRLRASDGPDKTPQPIFRRTRPPFSPARSSCSSRLIRVRITLSPADANGWRRKLKSRTIPPSRLGPRIPHIRISRQRREF
jgi:hypothetical protein